MKIPNVYHSAFKEEFTDLSKLDYYEKNNSYVFKHDLNDGVHELFSKCDCIYSEPAWQNGYELFIERADEKSLTYKDYLKSIESVIIELKNPSFIVGGKHMLRYITPHNHINIRFNGFNAILMFWFSNIIEVKNNKELLDILSKTYYTVLDFSCGYGEHLLKFDNFIGCDINDKCIYYIAKNYMGYEK